MLLLGQLAVASAVLILLMLNASSLPPELPGVLVIASDSNQA